MLKLLEEKTGNDGEDIDIDWKFPKRTPAAWEPAPRTNKKLNSFFIAK